MKLKKQCSKFEIMRIFLLLSVFIIAFASCKKDKKDTEAVDYSERDQELILDYLAKENIDAQVDKESGVFYVIDRLGDGIAVEANDSVYVQYIGKVLSRNSDTDEPELAEKPFDFSTQDQGARVFKLSNLIEGWKVGIPKIKKGGKIHLYIPSGKGYGNNYQSGIPANSVLYFDIDLDDVIKYVEEEE